MVAKEMFYFFKSCIFDKLFLTFYCFFSVILILKTTICLSQLSNSSSKETMIPYYHGDIENEREEIGTIL